jgi:hypothetical protein
LLPRYRWAARSCQISISPVLHICGIFCNKYRLTCAFQQMRIIPSLLHVCCFVEVHAQPMQLEEQLPIPAQVGRYFARHAHSGQWLAIVVNRPRSSWSVLARLSLRSRCPWTFLAARHRLLDCSIFMRYRGESEAKSNESASRLLTS